MLPVKKFLTGAAASAALWLTFGQALWADMSSSLGDLTVTPVVSGLDAPWAFGYLPDGTILITERGGRLLHVTGKGAAPIAGLPRIDVGGQGGLLDLLIPRDFAKTRQIFMTYSKRQRGGSGTAVARATLAPGADRLTGVQTIWEMSPGSSGGRHFGSRLVEAPDGSLFVTIGDRGDPDTAQDSGSHNGAIVHITKSGAPAGRGLGAGQPDIHSFGHRNPQGLDFAPDGTLWAVEHGARGGDELNRITQGTNYGWPVISYGTHYSGAKIGEGTAKPGLEQPVTYWDPSIAPSGLMIYDGDMFPQWRGDAFVGSLKFDYIARLDDRRDMAEVEQLISDETLRIRDIRQAPDGSIAFLSVGNGTLYRLAR